VRSLVVILLLMCTAGAATAESQLFEERKAMCVQCHGANGISPTPEVPSLGGMPELYTLLQLVAFREGNRTDPIMSEMIKDMTDDDLRAAAAWITALPLPTASVAPGEPARMERGRALAAQNRCGICHGPKYLGGEQMPPLAHQREDYLVKSLRAYKAERRIGDRAAMIEVLGPLKDADLADLAHYLAHVR
jgi:cytochrome c553